VFEITLFAPWNDQWGIVTKFLGAMTLATIATHPLDVVQSRMAAGFAGYTGVNVYYGLMRAMRDDDAYQGLFSSCALGLLSAPVRAKP